MRVLIVAFVCAAACFGRDWKPNEVEISLHRQKVYSLARDYVVATFNLQILEESSFNPVRFNSHGVWGNFEARVKELGGDRFEVQGWVHAVGNERARIRWTVHIRSPIDDPEAWRYTRIGDPLQSEPEFLGWKFGVYQSLGYAAEYDPRFLAGIYRRPSGK